MQAAVQYTTYTELCGKSLHWWQAGSPARAQILLALRNGSGQRRGKPVVLRMGLSGNLVQMSLAVKS